METQKIVPETLSQQERFEKLAKPLIEMLQTEFHPHASIVITYDSAEIFEGVMAFSVKE